MRRDRAMAESAGGWRGSRWRVAAWSAAAFMLVLPWFAMQVTDQVAWDVVDFAVLGALLAIVGVSYELAARKTVNTAYRWAVGIALGAAFILVGVNLAVGVIGTENNDANLMFGGVLGVGIIGAIITRLRPQGLAWVLFAMALAQALVAVIAVAAGAGSSGPIWPLDILMATTFFVTMWLISAWLFRLSARETIR